jgi:hypothetical protein
MVFTPDPEGIIEDLIDERGPKEKMAVKGLPARCPLDQLRNFISSIT